MLDKFGYAHIINPKGTSILFDCQTEGSQWWRSRFAVFESSRVLELNAFVTDDLYRPERRPWVLELATRMNSVFPTGSYCFDYDHGWVQYQTALSFGKREPSGAEIEELLNSISFPLRAWADAFRHRHSPVTPEAALNAALIRLDAYDKASVSDGTRRALMKVEKSSPAALVIDSDYPTTTLSLI